MNEKQIRGEIKIESLKHLNKIAQVPNQEYDCFDCEQLINTIYRDLFHFSIRQNGYGKSSTTKVMTSPIGAFYDFRNLTIQEKEERIINAKEGDILFFHTQSVNDFKPTKENRYPGHIALYLGDNQFIHAKASSGRVLISNLEEENYLEILVGYKDLIPYILTMQEKEENRTL